MRADFKKLLLLCLILFVATGFLASPSLAQYPNSLLVTEKILDFNSKIVINSDNTLFVTETIQVNVKNHQIKHGIYRDFPTLYKYMGAFKTKRLFEIKQVVLDYREVSYRTEDITGGTRVYIGDPNTIVSEGIHTYSITYLTNRQINFGSTENKDQLNYNVTGNGWNFVIEKASADIYFPERIDTNEIGIMAYIGPIGSMESNYLSRIRDDGKRGSFVHIESGRRLAEYEGLTIQIDFPKGLVNPPTQMDTINWFIGDNFVAIISIFIVAVVFFLYLYLWKKHGNDTEITGPIIPEYDAPNNLSAGAIRFINQRSKFDNKVITSLIVALSVKKFIAIKETDKNEYLIMLIKDPSSITEKDRLSIEELNLLSQLFVTSGEIAIQNALGKYSKNIIQQILKMPKSEAQAIPTYDRTSAISVENPVKTRILSSTYDPSLVHMVQNLKQTIESTVEGIYYKKNTKHVIIPTVLSLISAGLIFLWGNDNINGESFAYLIPLIITIGTLIMITYQISIHLKSWSWNIFKVITLGRLAIFGILSFIFTTSFFASTDLQTNTVINSILENLLIVGIPAVLVTINLFFYHLIQTRTLLGTEIQHKIEGLKLFISTVENQRYSSDLHKEIPHTMDVYEKYLPYAIALDIEPIWTKKFKDVIDKANIDPSTKNVRASGFLYGSAFAQSGFSNSFTSTINSASVAPTSSGSGSSGGGSGGGGGGGGGGGW